MTTYDYNGVTKTLTEWAREYGINPRSLASRIKLQGLTIAEALNKPIEERFIDLTGKVFTRWTVIKRADYVAGKHTHWICKCSCGKEKSIDGICLRNGSSRSCGCLMAEENRIHGLNDSRLQTVWENMIQRCKNENAPNYHHYGGRGIYVCDRWTNIKNFAEDMGEPPEGMSLDRIDNNGPYSPDNCRWATGSEQCRNSRQSRRWHVHGVMYETAEEAGIANGVTKSVICSWCNGRTEKGRRIPPKDGCWSELYYKENE